MHEILNRINRFRRLFSPADKKKFLFIAMLMAISGIMELVGIGILAGAVTLFLRAGTTFPLPLPQKLQELLLRADPGTCIIAGTAAVALLLVFKNIFMLYVLKKQSDFVRKLQYQLTCGFFRNCLGCDYLYYTANSSDRFNGQIERIMRMCDFFLNSTMQLLADILVIIFLTVGAIYFLPGLVLAGVVFMIICGALFYLSIRKQIIRLGEERKKLDAAENSLRLAGLLGIPQIKVAGIENYFLNEFQKLSGQICRNASRTSIYGNLPRLALETASVLLACGVFIFLYVLKTPQQEILLTFAIIVATLARMLPALSRANYNLTIMRNTAYLFDETADGLEMIPQEQLTASPDAAVPDATADIQLQNISFAYPGADPVFENYSLEIRRNTTVGIAGKSGRGKTTLLYMLLGLLRPDSGRILAGGNDITGDMVSWRKQCAFVPQEVFLFDATLRENIAFGVPPEEIDDARVAAALKTAQLPDFAERLHEKFSGYGKTVSGGQKQRIGIARALYRNPKLLILDEATSALDQDTETKFCEALRKLAGSMTIVLISHRPSLLKECDVTVELQ